MKRSDKRKNVAGETDSARDVRNLKELARSKGILWEDVLYDSKMDGISLEYALHRRVHLRYGDSDQGQDSPALKRPFRTHEIPGEPMIIITRGIYHGDGAVLFDAGSPPKRIDAEHFEPDNWSVFLTLSPDLGEACDRVCVAAEIPRDVAEGLVEAIYRWVTIGIYETGRLDPCTADRLVRFDVNAEVKLLLTKREK